MTSINSLRPDSTTARKRTNQSAELIEESIKRYGAARSIVIDEDNRILAGNGTIEGAKAAGIKNVRIIETDGSEIIAVKRTGLTEHEKVGLALADNRTSDLSDWDAEMLHQLSEEHDVSPWFDDDALAKFCGDEIEALDEMPELSDADKEPFQQMSFTLHDEQAEVVKEAIEKAKTMGDFVNTPNENSNGNAIARICELFLTWSK